MDVHLLSNLTSIELDTTTGWVKATRAAGETFLIQPRDALALMTWSQGNTHTLMTSQHAIDQEASLYANSIQGQARPVRLVEALPAEPARLPAQASRKRRRRTPLPLPTIQISQALPCLAACTTKTMTALLDFGPGPHDPWQLYPFCEDHLRAALAQREATGLSLRVIVEQLRADA